jgi:hypothetical protein
MTQNCFISLIVFFVSFVSKWLLVSQFCLICLIGDKKDMLRHLSHLRQMRQKVETNETNETKSWDKWDKKLRQNYDMVFEMGQMGQKVETNFFNRDYFMKGCLYQPARLRRHIVPAPARQVHLPLSLLVSVPGTYGRSTGRRCRRVSDLASGSNTLYLHINSHMFVLLSRLELITRQEEQKWQLVQRPASTSDRPWEWPIRPVSTTNLKTNDTHNVYTIIASSL